MNSTTKQPGNLASALSDAQAIIDAAEKRAAEIRAAVANAHEQAEQRGYQEGVVAAKRDVADAAVRLIEDTTNLGIKISDEAAKLALAICGTIIGEAVKVDPQIVRRIAERALHGCIAGDSVTVFVNPDDRDELVGCVDHLRRVAGGAKISIETDALLTRGGCIVKTEFGEIDASVELLVAAVAKRIGLTGA